MDLKRSTNVRQIKQSAELSVDKNVCAASKQCSICKRELCFLDLLHVEELIIHRDCFKCCFCNVRLHFDSYHLDRQFKYNYGLKFFCRQHYCLSLSEKINKLRELNCEPLISRTDNFQCPKSTLNHVEKPALRVFARPARAFFSQSDHHGSNKECTGFYYSRGNIQEKDSDANKNTRNLEKKALSKDQNQNLSSNSNDGLKKNDRFSNNHVQLQKMIENFDKTVLLNDVQQENEGGFLNTGSNGANSHSFGQQMTTFFSELFTTHQEENKENVKNDLATYENIGGCLNELKNRITDMKTISGNLEGKIRAGLNNEQLLVNWCHLNEVLKKLEIFESEFYAHLRLANDVEEYKNLRAELQRLLSVGVNDEVELDEDAILEEKCVMEKILRVLEDRDVVRKELMKCVESDST